MPDTTVMKVNSRYSPHGEMGQRYLASGKAVAMRLWNIEPGQGRETSREYETIGYVLRGRAELKLEGQTLVLEPGDCWVVPEGARHSYNVLESFEAVEATSPPAQVKSRDAAEH
jgi:quercetin dioxygenase-like cupin family protein